MSIIVSTDKGTPGHFSARLIELAAQLFRQVQLSDDIAEVLAHLTLLVDDLEGALRTFIETLIMDATQTYIFLDGLDEECLPDEPSRWENVKRLLDFLLQLARKPEANLKLWCSSQDRTQTREVLDDLSAQSQCLDILLDETVNSADIDAYFKEALEPELHHLTENPELDSAGIDELLKDLKDQVHGNFLWAGMIRQAIRDATSLDDLKKEIAFPGNFKQYLERQIHGLGRTHRRRVFIA
jgi:hypothetical protein